MEINMSKTQLLDIMVLANTNVPSGASAAELQKLFAEHRAKIEAAFAGNGKEGRIASSVAGKPLPSITDTAAATEASMTTWTQNATPDVAAVPIVPIGSEAPNDSRTSVAIIGIAPNVPNEAPVCTVDQEPTDDSKQTSEADMLELKLSNLRRRHEILRLRQEIEVIERCAGTGGQPSTAVQSNRSVNFHDIEYAFVKFSGEDRTYSVHDFVRHLEEICRQVNADDLLKFLTLLNSLTGAARLLPGRGALTYDALKPSPMNEFFDSWLQAVLATLA